MTGDAAANMFWSLISGSGDRNKILEKTFVDNMDLNAKREQGIAGTLFDTRYDQEQ